jgi:hypothetical protein
VRLFFGYLAGCPRRLLLRHGRLGSNHRQTLPVFTPHISNKSRHHFSRPRPLHFTTVGARALETQHRKVAFSPWNTRRLTADGVLAPRGCSSLIATFAQLPFWAAPGAGPAVRAAWRGAKLATSGRAPALGSRKCCVRSISSRSKTLPERISSTRRTV